jgi:hypothetical protein
MILNKVGPFQQILIDSPNIKDPENVFTAGVTACGQMDI